MSRKHWSAVILTWSSALAFTTTCSSLFCPQQYRCLEACARLATFLAAYNSFDVTGLICALYDRHTPLHNHWLATGCKVNMFFTVKHVSLLWRFFLLILSDV